MKLCIGSVVKATAGRDKGKIFVVIDFCDEKFTVIADGRSRRIENPKKKSVKHLTVINEIDTHAAAALADGKLTNLKLRKIIADYENV